MSIKIIAVKAFIKPPSLPNFLAIEGGGQMDVADIAEDSLRDIGKVWTEMLIEHALTRRKAQRGAGIEGGEKG